VGEASHYPMPGYVALQNKFQREKKGVSPMQRLALNLKKAHFLKKGEVLVDNSQESS